MKQTIIFFLLLSLAFPGVEAQNSVIVYADCYYQGRSHSLLPGEYRSNELGIGNNQMSSIRIPLGFRVTFYDDNNFRGESITATVSDVCFSPWNDRVSSMKIEVIGGGPSGEGITLYKDCDYRGGSKILSPGDYRAHQLGVGNNDLSSIRIPSGYRVTLYLDDGFQGRSLDLERDISCLKNISNFWNDAVSSIRVERKSSVLPDNTLPPANEELKVTLYRDCYYRGASREFGPGTYQSYELGIGNDALSSLRVPKGLEVILYADDRQGGSTIATSEDMACLDGLSWNDMVSSIQVIDTRGSGVRPDNTLPPAYNQEKVTLYRDCYYGGASREFGPGTYQSYELGIGNDALSSLRVPKGLEVILYADDRQGGSTIATSEDMACLDGFSWNDMVSSIKVIDTRGSGVRPDNTLPPAYNQEKVTLYRDCYFRGASREFGPGTYQSYELGVGNDQISSIQIPDGLEVTIYLDDSKRGRNMKLERDVSCLKDISGSWNDAISSINISRSRGGSSYRPGNNNRPNYGSSSGQVITLYADCDYRGASKELRAGTYGAYQLGVGNDQLSSIRVPDGMELTIYLDDRQRGRSHEIHGDVSCLKDLGSEWNDNVSSVKVGRLRGYNNSNYNHYSSSSDGEVTLFVDSDYGGRSVSLRPGSYPSLSQMGFPNDALSSIKIPYGYHAIVYTDEDFRGAHLKLIISSKSMIFNDKISSIEIIRN